MSPSGVFVHRCTVGDDPRDRRSVGNRARARGSSGGSRKEPRDGAEVPSLGNGVAVPITDADLSDAVGEHCAPRVLGLPKPTFGDWMGVRTRIAMLPWAPRRTCRHHQSASCRSLMTATDPRTSSTQHWRAPSRDTAITPCDSWRSVPAGHLGRLPGSCTLVKYDRPAIAIAVEADSRKCAWAVQHAKPTTPSMPRVFTGGRGNSVSACARLCGTGRGQVNCSSSSRQPHGMRPPRSTFPEAPVDDMGTAVWTLPGTDVDYRGAHLRHKSIPAIGVGELLTAIRSAGSDDAVVDLLHVDVQGVEFELLEPVAGDPVEHATDGGRHPQSMERGSVAVLLPRTRMGSAHRQTMQSALHDDPSHALGIHRTRWNAVVGEPVRSHAFAVVRLPLAVAVHGRHRSSDIHDRCQHTDGHHQRQRNRKQPGPVHLQIEVEQPASGTGCVTMRIDP
jgi:hypothetical protein